MRSPLETISGRFDHAVFTTYSINLHFFEQWVMPLIRTAGIRNVVVFADHTQLGDALDPRSVRSLGRSYHAVSSRLGPGAFHPKLIYLHGEGGTRACVSSANLTVDGQLRNLEAAFVLDSAASGHAAALADIAEFVRRLTAIAPVPTAEALHAALPARTETVEHTSSVRVVHNLDSPLIDEFPAGGPMTAVAPYADGGGAATTLIARGALTFITDGARFAAPASFFGGGWTVLARNFDERALHGKTYRNDDAQWLMIGSPNLSAQALMRTAHAGNTELAVVVTPPTPTLNPPDAPPWTGEPLETAAPRRQNFEHAARAQATVTAFNAWEDGDQIRVSGIDDGTTLEHWMDEEWHDLGQIADGSVPRPGDVRPYLVRTVDPPPRQAIVHRPTQLRQQRTRADAASRAADVVTALPLDLTGLRLLEDVLADLYALGSLSSERRRELEQLRRARSREEGEDIAEEETLSDWMPAHPDDEPRVPELYRSSWKNTPDALLALIRGALRLEPSKSDDEHELAEERIGLEQLDGEPEMATEEAANTVPVTTKSVLARYQSSLLLLLARGVSFLREAEDAALADLGFQVILGLHERLDGQQVEVDGDERALVEHELLLRQKLDLLIAYLRERNGRDPACLATARIHLADCLAATGVWEPLERERLEELAHATAAEIIAADISAAARAAADAGVSLDEATARLRPYADRADWSGFFVHGDEQLDAVEFDEQPFPWISGHDWFSSLDLSPAWRVAGYGAVVGFAAQKRYGVLVLNDTRTCPHQAHAVLVEPARQVVVEAAHRRADGRWLVRDYSPVSAGTVASMARIGVEALAEWSSRSSFAAYDTDQLPTGIRELVRATAALHTGR